MKNKSSPVRLLVLLLFLFAVPLATPSPAYACMCAKPASVHEALAEAKIVFVGKATTIEEQKFNVPGESYTVTMSSAVFNVTAVYKGEVGLQALVSSGLSDCDAYFEAGRNYIVFADEFPEPGKTSIWTSPYEASKVSIGTSPYETNNTPYGQRLYASQCSGTGSLISVEEHSYYQDLGSGRPPGSIDLSMFLETWFPAIILLALSLSMMLVLVFLRRRRKMTQWFR